MSFVCHRSLNGPTLSRTQSSHTCLERLDIRPTLSEWVFSYHESKGGKLSHTKWIFFKSNVGQMVFLGGDRDQPWPHSYIPPPHHNYNEPVQCQPVPPLLQQPRRSGGGEASSWRKHQCQDPQVSTTPGFQQGTSEGFWKQVVFLSHSQGPLSIIISCFYKYELKF